MHMQTQGGATHTPHVTPAFVIWRVDHESAGRPLGTHARKCGVGSRWCARSWCVWASGLGPNYLCVPYGDLLCVDFYYWWTTIWFISRGMLRDRVGPGEAGRCDL